MKIQIMFFKENEEKSHCLFFSNSIELNEDERKLRINFLNKINKENKPFLSLIELEEVKKDLISTMPEINFIEESVLNNVYCSWFSFETKYWEKFKDFVKSNTS